MIRKLLLFSLISLPVFGGPSDDNHIHIEQVNGGDDFSLEIQQWGFGNMIRFSADHDDNTLKLLQKGNNMYIGYTDAWGSGYNWGGDLDGLNNDVEVRQKCSFATCNAPRNGKCNKNPMLSLVGISLRINSAPARTRFHSDVCLSCTSASTPSACLTDEERCVSGAPAGDA